MLLRTTVGMSHQMNTIPLSFHSLYSDMTLQSDEIMFNRKMLQLVDQLEINGSILLIILTIFFTIIIVLANLEVKIPEYKEVSKTSQFDTQHKI